MLHQVLIISITYLKLVLMFRAIVHALWSSVILVGLAGTQLADNSPGLSTELELPSSVKTSVRNSISIVMITMHNMANPGYYTLAILVIILGFSKS